MEAWSNFTIKHKPETTISCCGAQDQEPQYCTVIMQCPRPQQSRCRSKRKIIIGVVILVLMIASALSIYTMTATENGQQHIRETVESFLSEDTLYTRGIKHVAPMRCNNCFPFDPKLLINNVGVCSQSDRKVTLLNLVTSSPQNRAHRDAIRNTWGSIHEIDGRTIKTVFLIGLTDKKTTKDLLRENDLHHDLIQGSFMDTYRNLTYKSVMGLKWAAKYCGEASFVMKSDDDTFIRIEWLMRYLKNLNPDNRFVTGRCFTTRPLRDKSSKWFIKESEYNDTFYPMYCSGQGYIISKAALVDIVAVMPHVPFLYLEDVYITGMCRNAMNISYITNEQIGVEGRFVNDCDYLSWIVTAHYINHTEIIRITRLITDDNYNGYCTVTVKYQSSITILVIVTLSIITTMIIGLVCFFFIYKRKGTSSREIIARLHERFYKQRRHSVIFESGSNWDGKIHRL